MALEQYMFDEAFNFHDENQASFKPKQDEPPNERWPPLGAASSDENGSTMVENQEDRYEYFWEKSNF